MNKNILSEAESIYQINQKDLGPIIVDKLGIKLSEFSPLREELSKYQAGSANLSEEGSEIVQDLELIESLKIIASPDFKLDLLTGGGLVPLIGMRIMASKDVSERKLVVLMPGFNDSYLINLFSNVEELTGWLTDILASNIEEPGQNFIPPPINPLALLYVFQVIDAFRRVSYENMLNHVVTLDPYIEVEKFNNSLVNSMKSLDIRWLVPSLLVLIPEFGTLIKDYSEEDLEYLVAHNLLIPTKEKESGKDIFLFGEAGTILGSEFLRSWTQSAGFLLEVLSSRGVEVLGKGYLATTALANHFFDFKQDNKGLYEIFHRPLTKDGFYETFRGMIIRALNSERKADSPVVVSTTKQTVPEVTATKAVNFCPECGKPVFPNAVFCTSCGKKLY